MTNKWPKVIRDPVHDIVPFEDTDCDKLLLDLINTREFQRLRRIKQLGMSEMVFPGANHSRFAHSIGVMHTARKFLERLSRLGQKIDENTETIVLTSALLHDLGHAPFSHAFEKITGKKHEDWTLDIIKNEETKIHQKLRGSDPGLPDKVAVFLDEESDKKDLKEKGILPFLPQVVSSQLDADRFDYLLRDSHATGTDYGRFDMNWLILHLNIDENNNRICLGPKALLGAESYIFARYHMYRVVYFHKAIRAAEVMLRLLVTRYKELLDNAQSDDDRKSIVPNSPRGFLDACTGTMSLRQFLSLDDSTVTEFFKCCADTSDGILSELGLGLANRRLYKGIDVTGEPPHIVADFQTEVANALSQAGLERKYTWVSDTPADVPYIPYDPDEEVPAKQIYVVESSGQPTEIGKQCPAIETLKKRYSLLRYYYPESIRDKIKSIVSKSLGRKGHDN
ncbi:MAG: HD domain-containing protein [Phycisphaerae bacterium]|nr:HD domain-containing protein [Phycisphaerae bacterium]